MKILFIVNDAPYGSEKAYNAFRLAIALQKEKSDIEIRIFLIADAVGCVVNNQETPQGYYNISKMLKSIILKKGKVMLWQSCAKARGLRDVSILKDVIIGGMADLAKWSIDSDKVFNF